MLKNKSQTATEYLVILAVVIVIALIVVGVLGGIPSIGGGVSSSSSTVNSLVKNLPITSYAQGCGYTELTIQNRFPNYIEITGIEIDNVSCPIETLPALLKSGESFQTECWGVFECDLNIAKNNVNIYYLDVASSGRYVGTTFIETDVATSLPEKTVFVESGYVYLFANIGSQTLDEFYVASEWNLTGSSNRLVFYNRSLTASSYYRYEIPIFAGGGERWVQIGLPTSTDVGSWPVPSAFAFSFDTPFNYTIDEQYIYFGRCESSNCSADEGLFSFWFNNFGNVTA